MATIRIPASKPESNQPKFNSPALQRTVNSNLNRFKAFQDSLNKISEDIQALEKFLKECGLNVTFSWFTPEYNSGFRLALAWERSENKDFRLTVLKYQSGGGYNDEWELSEEESHKPLISETSEVRRLLWTHLPAFVEKLSKDALGPVEALSTDSFPSDDCPF